MWGLPQPSPASRPDSSPPGPKPCCVSLCKSGRPGELSARKPGVSPRTVQGQGSSALLRLGSMPSLKTGNDHTLQCGMSTGAKPTLPRVVVVLAGEHSMKPSYLGDPDSQSRDFSLSLLSHLSSFSRPGPVLVCFHSCPTLLPLAAREPVNSQVLFLASSPTLAPPCSL